MSARFNGDHPAAASTPPYYARPDLACRDAGVDPEWFYPGRGDSPERALTVCRRCPAAGECRDWALQTRQEFGVWGGTTAEDRDRLKYGASA